MDLVQPFVAIRPKPGFEEKVLAPPYDVVSVAEAREIAAANPYSFLHISKAEIDFPVEQKPQAADVYRKAADNLKHLLDTGVLQQDKQASYSVYRLKQGKHEQIGLVAAVSVEAYRANLIRTHEQTRPEKERDRVNLICALKAQMTPVILTYRHQPSLDDFFEQVTQQPPACCVTAADGVEHTIWSITDTDYISTITHKINEMGVLYIADGHHRCAAAAGAADRFAKEGMLGDSQSTFLAAIFPHTQMQILSYNCVIKDLGRFSVDEFLSALEENFSVEAVPAAFSPQNHHEYGCYIAGQWYCLSYQHPLSDNSPVQSLDVSVLHASVIKPLLGIAEPRSNPRIDFIGGRNSLSALEHAVDHEGMSVAFSFYPTSIEQLMQVADLKGNMPPKSTWFEPKLADGLLAFLL